MTVRRRAPVALAVALAFACGTGVAGSTPAVAAPAPPNGDALSVYVLTFGPGDHPFLKFGHDAIWIHDAATLTDRVYNFGTFSFDSPRLIVDFLQGRLTYWLSVSSLGVTLGSYAHDNRSIFAQELALDAAAKAGLLASLDDNARPENRAYKYDYFLDNCATRVRDAIDRASGGRLRARAGGPARLTLRQQALRLTADYLPLYLALDLVLGPDVDRPVDRWAEMYIPEELSRGLAAVGTSGEVGDRPLVSRADNLFVARRAPPLEDPPAWARGFFLAGVCAGLTVFFLASASGLPPVSTRRRAACRAVLGFSLAIWGLVVGVVGCFLVFAWGWTDHLVAHHNQNVLLCAPWSIGLGVAGLGVALGRPRAVRAARALALAALAAALAAVVVKLGLARHQDNLALIAFFVPAWLGISLGVTRLARLAPRRTDVS